MGTKSSGLARSDASIAALTAAGAEPHQGFLTNLESLKRGAASADGVIHLAFVHGFSDFPGACATDGAAIATMGEVLAGTGKPLVIASGTLSGGKGGLATEDTEPERGTPFSDRAKSADLIYALSKEKGIRGSVIRLSPKVYGTGDAAFIPMLINTYRQNGAAVYVDSGSARWPTVHREDAAVLLRLALEKGKAGSTYDGVAEQGVSLTEIATLIGSKLQLPVKGEPAHSASVGALGFLGHLIAMDGPTSSEKTQKELGCRPTQLDLLADMEANYIS